MRCKGVRNRSAYATACHIYCITGVEIARAGEHIASVGEHIALAIQQTVVVGAASMLTIVASLFGAQVPLLLQQSRLQAGGTSCSAVRACGCQALSWHGGDRHSRRLLQTSSQCMTIRWRRPLGRLASAAAVSCTIQCSQRRQL